MASQDARVPSYRGSLLIFLLHLLILDPSVKDSLVLGLALGEIFLFIKREIFPLAHIRGQRLCRLDDFVLLQLIDFIVLLPVDREALGPDTLHLKKDLPGPFPKGPVGLQEAFEEAFPLGLGLEALEFLEEGGLDLVALANAVIIRELSLLE